MKRLILTLAIILCFGAQAFAEGELTVFMDGKALEAEISPVIINDRAMLPMRAVFESIGAQVDWLEEEQIIIEAKEGLIISFKIGSDIMIMQDMTDGAERQRVILDSPPVIIGSSAVVPVRAVAEAFGAEVIWDGENNAVRIETNSLIREEKE